MLWHRQNLRRFRLLSMIDTVIDYLLFTIFAALL
jgi:hypothetical protein